MTRFEKSLGKVIARLEESIPQIPAAERAKFVEVLRQLRPLGTLLKGVGSPALVASFEAIKDGLIVFALHAYAPFVGVGDEKAVEHLGEIMPRLLLTTSHANEAARALTGAIDDEAAR